MKISKSKFEQKLNSLINAALSVNSKEVARKYLNESDNKIYTYYNIPNTLKTKYRNMIQDAKRRIRFIDVQGDEIF